MGHDSLIYCENCLDYREIKIKSYYHNCPYREDVKGDYLSKCSCCKQCLKECIRDI